MALPQNLNYSSKINSAPSTCITTCLQPQSGTGIYTVNNTIIFNIPCQNNTVLSTTESYLKFKFNITNTGAENTVIWDSSSHSLFERLKIYHGSNLLQDISSYNLLAKMLFNLQVPDDTLQGKFNVLCGAKTDYKALSTGEGWTMPANSTMTFDYCLNLISLLGTLNNNSYFPLFGAQSSPLRLELTLVSSPQSAYCDITGNTSFTLTDVEYVANFIKLSDSAMSMIYGSLGGEPLQLVVPDWSNYSTNISLVEDAKTQISFPINAKYSSLKSIIIACRQKTNNRGYFPLSSTQQGCSEYFFRVGGEILPSKSPNSAVMFYSELIKAVSGSMSDLTHSPNINLVAYKKDFDILLDRDSVITNQSGSAYWGIDLENFPNSTKSGTFAGFNSNTVDIYWVPTFTSTVAGTNSYRLDAFSLFDSVIVFENSTCYRKF